MRYSKIILVLLCLLTATIAYADLTRSPANLPLDDRIALDKNNLQLFSKHYLKSKIQFSAIDENLAYLNCGSEFEPTSAFYLNVPSYVNSEVFGIYLKSVGLPASKRDQYINSCKSSVLITVAHYLGESVPDTCAVISRMDGTDRAIGIRKDSYSRGEVSYTKMKTTRTTAGTDFAILLTNRPADADGIPLCANSDAICEMPSDLTLAHLKYSRNVYHTVIPDKAITARCRARNYRRLPSVNSERLDHTCSALHGSSGGPIINLSCDKICAVGMQNIAFNQDHKNALILNHALSLKSEFFIQKMNSFITKNCSN